MAHRHHRKHNMPAVARKGDMSQGLDGPATSLTHKIQAVKSYVDGILIGLVGDQYEAHAVGETVHQNGQRQIVSGASKTYFEGIAVARTNDQIADGDKVGAGSAKLTVE
jgi:uncharacterized Zn-binding protein involved in type VI secretion